MLHVAAPSFGQYTLNRALGEGGYSTVYKCVDEIGVRYACKKLPKAKNKRARVSQEISVMKALRRSPKIVRFVDAGEDEENFYIIQELCRGGSAEEYLRNFSNYGENTVASMVRGTLRGLVHMHAEGIIHRDIKAGNIMLGDQSEDADVKIGDMGTAIFVNTHGMEVPVEVESGELVGTPWYMAPENLSCQYHSRSDIWSLGVMTYYMLSGRLPFNDRKNPIHPSLPAIWRAVLNEEPSFVGPRWDPISAEAKDLVAMCLRKSYQERPSARELLSHPWLTRTDCTDRFQGTPLACQPFQEEETMLPRMDARTIRTENPGKEKLVID